jgi:nucleoside triphosphate diphosphatase
MEKLKEMKGTLVEKNNFERILDVIDTLTGPNGCPWDKEQTPQTMCDYLVEECFELVEAIRQDDKAEIAEELGDVLFLLLFIGRCHDREIPDFLQTALAGNVAKMIRRHPHVYGEKAADVAEVVRNWEKIKKRKKPKRTRTPACSPPCPPACRRFCAPTASTPRPPARASPGPRRGSGSKLAEEWNELQAALAGDDAAAKEEEFGDYLFSLVEYGRRRGIKANSALAVANAKFLRRFDGHGKVGRGARPGTGQALL